MDRLKLMETYAAVVQLGSYTRAAKELGVTRAMVSKRIQDLEAVFGVRLLSRNTHSLSVTATGADYYESCTQLLADLAVLEDRMQTRRQDPRGLLKILTSKTFGETILAPVTAEFCTRYPNIQVQMALGDWAQGQDLISAGYDMVIRRLPVRDSALVARQIVALERVLVATTEYLEVRGIPKFPTDLSRHNCLDSRGAALHVWEFDGSEGHASVRVTGSPRANSSIAILHAARGGLGIALLSTYLVADDLASGRLIRVLPGWRAEARKLYAVYQKDAHRPLRTRLFLDYLIARTREIADSSESRPPAQPERMRSGARARRT